MSLDRVRSQAFKALVRYGSSPVLAGAFERVRNLSTYAMGAGTASLHVEESAATARGALVR